MMQRSKQRVPDDAAQVPATLDTRGENARVGEEGQSSRVPSQGAGVPSSSDWPQDAGMRAAEPGLSDLKRVPLKNVGRDARGKVISYKRNEKTAREVAGWVAGGYDANAICVQLNMRPGTLKELYAAEIAYGLEKVGMLMTSHIIARAKKSDRMAIFFAKARMGWRDGETKPQDTGGLFNIVIHQ